MSAGSHFALFALKRSGNNAIKYWLTQKRHFAVQGNVRHKHVMPRKRIPTAPNRLELDWPIDLSALKRHGTWLFRARTALGFPLYLGLEDQQFVPSPMPGFLHILVLRSFENVFASRLARAAEGHKAYPAEWGDRLEWQVALWCQHADEALAHTDEAGVPLHADVVPIFYDRWLTNPQYRHQIGDLLGVIDPTTLPERRGRGGKGSSFDGLQPLTSEVEVDKLLNRATLLDARTRALLSQMEHLPEIRVRIDALKERFGR